MVDAKWLGFRRGGRGELCWNGWAVFGHILPRVELADFPCYANGVTADEIGQTVDTCAYVRDGFVIEWFGRGLCLALGDVRLLI